MALISFSSVGFFLSFLFPVLGIFVARIRGGWKDDPRLFIGRAAPIISIVALVWLIFQIVNVAWPRDSGGGWATDWSTVIGVVVIAVLGILVDRWLAIRRKNEKFVKPSTPLASERQGRSK